MPYMTKPVPSPYPVTTTTPMDDDFTPLGGCGGYGGPCASPSASATSPVASATHTIAAPTHPAQQATLPVTGPDPIVLVTLAVGLLALGLFLYAATRRRSRLM